MKHRRLEKTTNDAPYIYMWLTDCAVNKTTKHLSPNLCIEQNILHIH